MHFTAFLSMLYLVEFLDKQEKLRFDDLCSANRTRENPQTTSGQRLNCQLLASECKSDIRLDPRLVHICTTSL